MVLCAAEDSDREIQVMNLWRFQKDKKRGDASALMHAFHLGEKCSST
jgi:hypothetical protein